jgi:L-malate glycosyltransferase
VRVAVGLAAGLASRGHAVHVFAPTSPLAASRPVAGVTLHRLRAGRILDPRLHPRWPRSELESFVRLVAGGAERHGLDVLHFHYALPFTEVAARVRAGLGAAAPRLVMTLHGTDVTRFAAGTAGGPRLGRDLARLDRVTTVSESHARLSADVLALDRLPLVIPNFVDLRAFRPPAGRRTRRDGRRRLRIVHVSNFRPVKHPEAVARVFVRVRERIDAELWLIGDGHGMSGTREILRAGGVERDVRFFGLRRQIHSLLPGGDVLLLTSRTESFSLAALEAAACGIPAVAPRVGGLPEVVAHGESGLLYEPGAEEEAADAVVFLAGDTETRSAMAAAALRRASLFSSDAIVGCYLGLYRELLDEPAPAGARPAAVAVAGAHG